MAHPHILAALSPEGSSVVPVVIPYEGIFIRDHFEELFSVPWWYAHSLDVNQQLLYMEQYLSVLDIDWYSPFLVHSDSYRQNHQMAVNPDFVEFIDQKTARKTKIDRPQISGVGSDCQQDLFVPYEQIEKDPERIRMTAADKAFRLWGKGVDSLIPRQKQLAAGRKSALGFVESPFESIFNIWGFTSSMLLLSDDKSLIHLACSAYLEAALTTIETCSRLGCKLIWVEECFSDLISPDDYENLVLPYLIPVIDAIKQTGMHSIYYFTGNPQNKMDLILSLGADAYSFEDDKKGFHIDLAALVDRLAGKAALLGNLNAITDLQDASDEKLYQRLDYYIELARRYKGRFIMSLGSPVTPGTSVDRVRKYIAYTREKGKI